MRDLTLVFRTGLAFLCAGAMLCGQGLVAQTQPQTTASQAQPPSQGLPPTTISLQNDTLAGVRYDNRWQFYFGAGYRHFNAGPQLIQGSNMGGPDMQVTRRLSPHWGATGNVRMYWGTSGVVPNSLGIEGPLVSEYDFFGGPEFRGPHNKHVAVNLHALVGGSYGVYQTELNGNPPGLLGFYSDGLAFGSAFGGAVDLNRSPKLALRISPDLMVTHHGNQFQEQFAISVGLLYRFSNQRHHKQQPAQQQPAAK